jgi:hypothetical protein
MSNDIDQPPELDWLDSAIITRLEPQVREWIAEAGQYFPDPPTVHTIHWFGGRSSLITKSSGVGGFSYAPGEISLAWNEDYQSDKDKQIEFFKDTVFHEFYHQVQGYVGVGGQLGDLSPLQVAVYEGAASVFARDKTGIADTFVDYSDLTQITLMQLHKSLVV